MAVIFSGGQILKTSMKTTSASDGGETVFIVFQKSLMTSFCRMILLHSLTHKKLTLTNTYMEDVVKANGGVNTIRTEETICEQKESGLFFAFNFMGA